MSASPMPVLGVSSRTFIAKASALLQTQRTVMRFAGSP